ncbi:MAG: hypothetical protein A2901_01105 [Elusimicrobia bacterium RIFCSPLOWO2_01_FULL_54_10]|nr:MAG: hypothetical protein A2901_01105 [Elusimicrobia bacterium RIFCSPLOWO2_01_FULL_54_10]
MSKYICILLLISLTGCGATIHSQLVKKDARMGDCKKVHLMIATAGGGISVTSAGMGSGTASANATPTGVSAGAIGLGLSASHVMSGNDQINMAVQDIAFALRDMGFDTIEKTGEADAIALFSIGTVRYDPLTGWIADRAFLDFKDNKTGSMILSIKANTRFVTPTVGSLVRNIVSELKKYR